MPTRPSAREELAFWLLMLTATWGNSSVGVLMEGPVLGVWFWFALGFAWGRSLAFPTRHEASAVGGGFAGPDDADHGSTGGCIVRVLMLHNRYRQPGGEDLSASAEVDNLRAHGIEVIDQQFDNEVPPGSGVAGSLRLALGSAWSRRSHQEVSRLCEQHSPDVAHVQNFWMKLSPSVHDACHRAGVPTVQALRNFRLLCTNALFLRQARVCEDCLGKLPWRGVVHRCYRDSAVASAAVSQMIWFNRRRGTWERDVDAFIASTEHSRSKFIAGRLPAGAHLRQAQLSRRPW